MGCPQRTEPARVVRVQEAAAMIFEWVWLGVIVALILCGVIDCLRAVREATRDV